MSETVNSMLRGIFTSVDKGHVRVLESAKSRILHAHTIAGYNRWTMKNWNFTEEQLADEGEPTSHPAGPTNNPTKAPAGKRKARSNRRTRWNDLNVLRGSPPTD